MIESWLLGSLGDSFGPFDIREADKKDVPFFFAHECANRVHFPDIPSDLGGESEFLKETGGCRLAADWAAYELVGHGNLPSLGPTLF